MRVMKLVIPSIIIVGGFVFYTSSMTGTPAYAKKEKKACTTCHAKVVSDKDEMVKNLTSVGDCYKSNDHSLAKCSTK